MDHVQESVCVPATGWLDPVIMNGKVLKKFDPVRTPEYLARA